MAALRAVTKGAHSALKTAAPKEILTVEHWGVRWAALSVDSMGQYWAAPMVALKVLLLAVRMAAERGLPMAAKSVDYLAMCWAEVWAAR